MYYGEMLSHKKLPIGLRGSKQGRNFDVLVVQSISDTVAVTLPKVYRDLSLASMQRCAMINPNLCRSSFSRI
jgi:hypothetical protein